LVEAAVALPVLLLLAFGLIQFGCLAWQRVMLQHAAHCAARAYSVWQAEEPAQALAKAERAAWLALRGTPRPQSLHVALIPSPASTPQAMGSGAKAPKVDDAVHNLELSAHWLPLVRLPFWRDGFSFSAHCGILKESLPAENGPDQK
jgi:hypothetical protein